MSSVSFKKKRITKKNLRSSITAEDEPGPVIESTNLGDSKDSPDHQEQDEINVDDILLIRKFKKKNRGLDALASIKSEPRKRKGQDGDDQDEDGPIDPFAKIKKGFGQDGSGPSTSFAAASTAMDADKHMREYVEKQLKKKQTVNETAPESASHDINDALFQFPEHLQLASKPIKEDNVSISASMLAAVPEVDLGVENKLRNIERTEEAKRRLLETDVNIVPIDSTRFRTTGEQQTYEAKPFATDSLVLDKFRKRLKRT